MRILWLDNFKVYAWLQCRGCTYRYRALQNYICIQSGVTCKQPSLGEAIHAGGML